MPKQKTAKKLKKKSRHSSSKNVPRDVVKIEWQHKLRNATDLQIVVAQVSEEFIMDDNSAYIRMYVDMRPALITAPKIIRTDVYGKIHRVYLERMSDSLVVFIRHITTSSLPDYFERVVIQKRKQQLKIDIVRGE